MSEETQKEPGILSPYPPCCDPKCTTFRACGEDNKTCYSIGKIGTETPFGVPRHRWMLAAGVINTICLVFLIAGAFGVSTDASILRNTYWSKIKNNGVTLYIGPSAVITHYSGSDDVTSWSNIECSGFLDEDACEDCSDAASSTVATAIMGVVTTLPTILTDIQRSTRAGDLNCQKVMAVLTGLLGGLSSLATLITYGQNCWKVSNASNAHAGPGFILQLLGTILKFSDIFFHMYLSTPPYKHGVGLRDEDGLETSGSLNA